MTVTAAARGAPVRARTARSDAAASPQRRRASLGDEGRNPSVATMMGNMSESQWEAQKQGMANADPEQMRAQANMMKNMSKSTLRASNPQFANMSDAQIDMAIGQMEMMASNPAMFKMAMQNMQGVSYSQAQSQMAAAGLGGGGAARPRPAAQQMLAAGYAVGDRVELHGLKGAAEHNGKEGTVTGAQGERLKVLLDGVETKTLALKPANLTKLAVDDAAVAAAPAAPSGGLVPGGAGMPPLDANTIKQASEAMKSMDPSAMAAQASMMRNMDPATLRASNPQFAAMSDEQIAATCDQMEAMSKNPEMMEMATKQMANLPPEVLEQQMKMFQNMSPDERAEMQKAAAKMAQNGDLAKIAESMKAGDGPPDAEAAAKIMGSMDSETMGSMVDVMKKNPEMMKAAMKANPMTRNMTDEQLDKQMEALNSLDEETVKLWLGRAQKVASFFAPAVGAYSKANKALGGRLPKVLGVALLGVVASWVLRKLGLTGGATAADAAVASSIETLQAAAAEAASTVTAAVEEDEFELGSA